MQICPIDKLKSPNFQFNSLLYNSTGGFYVPTQFQYTFCKKNIHLFNTPEEKDVINQIFYGYSCSEKVNHDYIHIVIEIIRKKNHDQ